MIGHHRLSGPDLDALATGLGDAGLVRTLREAQVSKRMLQLRTLLEMAPSAATAEHFALLSEAVRRAPEVGPAVLSLPHTGAWLAATLRRLRRVPAGPAADPPIEIDLHHLGAVAAVAAIRAGIEFKVELATRSGTVLLPSMGRAEVGAVSRVVMSHVGGRIQVGPVTVPSASATADVTPDSGGWAALRHLRRTVDGLSIDICLDDLDPFRDCHRLCAASRLDPAAVRSWQALLDDAWPILVEHHREYAEAIAEGVRTLVPLQAEDANAGVNVTSMDAFGAVSMTPPADGHGLALGLLHEFQHAKLGATIDITPLYRRDDRLYYAPWRDDPRPIGAALQGVYAFLGVTEFWRVQRRVLADGRARLAEVEFARWRDRVTRTCAELATSDRLTTAGRRFVTGMAAAGAAWRDEPVPPEAAELAREAAEDHWVGWQLRNRRPAEESVGLLASAWRAGSPRPAETVETTVAPAAGRWLSRSTRLDLVRLRLADPDRFQRLRDGAERLADVLPDASPGDLALACGDNSAAQEIYRQEILREPDRLASWIGLTLAGQRGAQAGAAPSIRRPELCRAVYQRVVAVAPTDVDPVALAHWLSVPAVM